MALIIKADGTEQFVAPKNGVDFQLKELQAIVGGYIEILNTVKTPGTIMVIDEEGKLKGKEINLKATALYKYGESDPVVGDVLLCYSSEVQ